MQPLENKLALVTGVTSGIGLEITQALSEQKTNLFLIGRNEQVLKELHGLYHKSIHIEYHKADLTNDKELDGLLSFMQKSSIEPDILIHCAGIFNHARIQDSTNDLIDHTFRLNFRAPFILTRELLDIIIKKKGQVLFVNSTASKFPKAYTAAYSSSKSALKTFAEVLYEEVHSLGVRVSTIYPGMVATPMQKLVKKAEGREYIAEKYLDPRIIAQLVIQLLTMPVNAEIREITIRPNHLIE